MASPKKRLYVQMLFLVTGVAVIGFLVNVTSSAATKWRSVYTGDTAADTSFNVSVLTPDGTDYYDVKNVSGNVYVSAPSTNTSGNLRQILWPKKKQFVLNSTVCSTWVGDSTQMAQEGLAVRVTNKNGVVRALTVTKNVIYGVHWAFNVHIWDSSNWGGTETQAFKSIAQYDMRDVIMNDIGQLEYMPWRVCLRAVDAKLTFKIWFPNKMTEPSWKDSRYTRSVTIPPEYMVPGASGWYVGHIPANGNIEYLHLDSWKRT